MYAVEFEASIENGIVKIPKKYQDLQEKKKAKFVVIYDNDDKKSYEAEKAVSSNKFDKFLSFATQVEDVKIYSKEQLHER